MLSWQLPVVFAILVCSTAVQAGQGWPYNLPKDQKYWPEHEHLARRHVEVQEQLATQKPTGIKKMSDDPSEMFFLDYWLFEPPEAEPKEREIDSLSRRGVFDEFLNASMTDGLLPPLLPHSDDQSPNWFGLRNAPRDIFQKRNFQCPNGTNACTSINRPNSCCATDETCMIITDTGIGDVGCCPQGSSCGGSVSSCNTAQGYQSCPGADSGGCCIPHFTCNGVGCAAGGTTTSVRVVLTTVTITPGEVTVTSTSAQPPPTTTTSTVTPSTTSNSAPSTSTVFTTLPTSTDTTVVASNSTSTSAQCTSGFNTCAASMGGGCCPTDRACGTGGTCLPLSTASSSSSSSEPASTTTTTQSPSMTSATAAAPIRPTSGNSMCPTGYYMCSAYYIGGCCQNNRNCDTTNCPASTTQTIVSDGETILVPGTGAVSTGAVSTATSSEVSAQDVTTASAATSGPTGPGQCATGWSLCAASQGGGCCPSGYGCAAASCTATAPVSPNQVAKAAPASGSVRAVDNLGPLLIAVVTGVGAAMLLL